MLPIVVMQDSEVMLVTPPLVSQGELEPQMDGMCLVLLWKPKKGQWILVTLHSPKGQRETKIMSC